MTRTRWLVVATVISVVMAVGINTIDAPGTMVWFRALTGGLGTLDVLPLAGDAVVYDLLTKMGHEGRMLYLKEIALFDLAFPVALFVMVRLALLLAWAPAVARRLLLLPWAALTFDLAENACASALAILFPDRWPALAEVIGWITAAKFIAYTAGFVGAIAGGVVVVVRRQRASSAPERT